MRFERSERRRPESHPRLVSPSDLERKLLVLLVRGLQNKEIAAWLGTTEGNVANRLGELVRGLRLHDRGEMRIWAMQRDLTQEWVELRLHPPGCRCGSWYCEWWLKNSLLLEGPYLPVPPVAPTAGAPAGA